MQKIKINNKLITILFIVYLIISFFINSVKMIYDYFDEVEIGTDFNKGSFIALYEKELQDMTEEDKEELEIIKQMPDDEFEGYVRQRLYINIFIILGISLAITFFKNIFLIILFIVIKLVSKKIRKEKLNKDDFKRSKDYYRDVLDGYGACELSWIDDFKLEIPKDIIAELLQLENEKVIKINEDNIEMLENFDTNNLNETQKYLLSCIEDGKVKNISEIKLQETVRKDALKHKIVEQREESKKKKKKRMFKAILIAVIVNIVMRVAFNIISEMNFENNMIPIISFVIYVIALMIFALYPTIVIISFIIYNVKSTLDPYFRTKEGEELNRSIEGLKNYLKDYTLLDEQEKDGIVVWEEYLVYSVLFNQNKKMIEKYKSAGDIHKGGEVGQADALAAVLVGCHLCNDLGGDVAGGGEAVRLFNIGAGNDGAVLQHVLQIHQIAVVHVLGKVVGIVEVDQTLLMCLDDLRVQQQTGGQIFGDLTGHIVALYAVHGGVLIGVLLLDLFVLALDQAQDALIGGVSLALQALHIAVGDVVPGHIMCLDVHELVLHHILHFFHADGAVQRLTLVGNSSGDLGDLVLCQTALTAHRIAGLSNSGDDLGDIKGDLCTVAFDDLHRLSSLTNKAQCERVPLTIRDTRFAHTISNKLNVALFYHYLVASQGKYHYILRFGVLAKIHG